MSVTDGELESIREAQNQFMPGKKGKIHLKTIIAPEMEADDFIENVPYRLSAGFGRFEAIADRFQGITPYVLTVPHNQEINPGDEFFDETGSKFEVRDVKDKSSYQTARQCLVDRHH